AVGHHGDAAESAAVLAVVVVAGDLLAGLEVPDADRLLVAAGDRLFAVGSEGDAGDVIAVRGHLFQLLAGRGVPEAEGVVPAAAEDALAVLRPGKGRGAAVFLGPLQLQQLLARAQVPDPRGAMAVNPATARDRPLAFGRHGDADDGLLVPGEAADLDVR